MSRCQHYFVFKALSSFFVCFSICCQQFFQSLKSLLMALPMYSSMRHSLNTLCVEGELQCIQLFQCKVLPFYRFNLPFFFVFSPKVGCNPYFQFQFPKLLGIWFPFNEDVIKLLLEEVVGHLPRCQFCMFYFNASAVSVILILIRPFT